MTTVRSSRVNQAILHARLAYLKDTLIFSHNNGYTLKWLSRIYDIRESTLGDWMYYWKCGKKRQPEYLIHKGIEYYANPQQPKKRQWSKEFLERQKYNTAINKRLVKHIQVCSTGSDEWMVHKVCGMSV